jgi:hypothetical protein
MYPPPAPIPPEQAFDYTSGWGQQSPMGLMGLGGMPPQLPDPNVGAAPPSANPTGGVAPSAHADTRSSVHAQLYRLGKQASGQANMFEQFGPQAPSTPPVPGMPLPPPLPEDPRYVQAQPQGHLPGPLPPAEEEPPRPFPRLSRLMGRPILPEPKKQKPSPPQPR